MHIFIVYSNSPPPPLYKNALRIGKIVLSAETIASHMA